MTDVPTCPKCKVELNPMRVFGWADFCLCPRCDLAYSLESLKRYVQVAPVSNSAIKPPIQRRGDAS